MKKLKSHFKYHKDQRNGIFALLLLVILFQIAYFFLDFSSDGTVDINTQEVLKFRQEIDSLKKIELEARKPKIFPFNPNYITDVKGYELGMTNEEIDLLHAFRSSGKFVNSAKEFQKVTKVSDSLLAIITPYFKFPDWVVAKKKTQVKKEKAKNTPLSLSFSDKKDLNTVAAEELLQVYGVGEIMSKRIVKFRSSLQGFSSDTMLYKVYGLKPEIVEEIMKYYTVKSKPEISPININTATFKEVLKVPYIDYELTKKIFQYKDQNNGFNSIEELLNIEGLDQEIFDKIVVYLEAN
ncbi:helix-hairpin-helix domain-containing protein [Urechidicola sp. KH5]